MEVTGGELSLYNLLESSRCAAQYVCQIPLVRETDEAIGSPLCPSVCCCDALCSLQCEVNVMFFCWP